MAYVARVLLALAILLAGVWAAAAMYLGPPGSASWAIALGAAAGIGAVSVLLGRWRSWSLPLVLVAYVAFCLRWSGVERSNAPHWQADDVVGQRLMQSASDIFLGWSRGPSGRDFYVRQLRDMKVSPAVESQTPQVMRAYATLCGLALARAHDKAGDATMIAGYLGKADQFDEAVADYAVAYADQVERDYATFVTAVRNGRMKSDLSPRQMEAVLR